MNPIVEIIARALFAAECESGVVGAWEAAPRLRRRSTVERVEDVLLAATNAGYILVRAPSLETLPKTAPPLVLWIKMIGGVPHAFSAPSGDRHRYVLNDAARIELSERDTIPAPPGEGEEE